jgi:hypothetical protein
VGLIFALLSVGMFGAPAAGFDRFAPGPVGAATECVGFADVTTSNPACVAIATLVANGIINGYATNPPRFGPNDGVQRAQIAAFLVRGLAWQGEATGPRSFTDFGVLVAELRTASLILANKCDTTGLCTARGYEAAGCAARGLAFPCFGPNDGVTHAQVISFIARAFQFDADHGWVPQQNGSMPYQGVPGVHQVDVKTYHANAGTIPAPPGSEADWNKPAPRAWVARVLFQALGLPPVAVPTWGPTLAPLSNNFFNYSDPQGRFSTRVPQAWTQIQQGGNNVYFRQPGPLWGAEIALSDKGGFTHIDQVDPVIEQQLNDWLKEYVPISKGKVVVGSHEAYRRVFQHRNNENQTEIIVRIYFLSGSHLYQVNGFMLPGDRGTVEPLVDGLAGSIVTNP